MNRISRLSVGLLSISVFFFSLCLPQLVPGAESPTYQIKIEKNAAGLMRDGVKLFADIYRPDIPEKVPVILIRTPYNKESYGREYAFPRYAAQRGYAVVVQDVRGRFSSEGEFVPYAQELNDGYDSVEWAAGLPFSNGKVGMTGCSYLGAVQWQAAVMNPPHLVAIFPQCTFSNARHFFFFGGTFDLSWILWLNGRLPDIKLHRGIQGREASEEVAEADWEAHKWEWMSYLPLRDFPLFKGFCPYYYDWLSHPDDGPFWDFANVEKRHSEVSVPAYSLSGWYDDGYGQPGAIRNFLGMRKNGKTPQARDGQKLIIGPWTHCDPETRAGRVDFGEEAPVNVSELAVRWFDYWLKGIDNAIKEEPPIKIFIMGENRWRFETEWPPARAKQTSFYLGGAGPANSLYGRGILTQQSPSYEGHDHYTYDPANPVTDYFFEEPGPRDLRPIETRNDVLVYTSAPLPCDTEVTGEIRAELWASSTARDTDFVVKLADVDPGGVSLNVTSPLSGVIRARYRESESSPMPLTPGKIYKYAIDSMYTSYVFEAGHRIRVWISSSYFPFIDRNLNTDHAFGQDKEMLTAEQTVYYGKKYPSRMILPIIQN
jgi:putative CocE/NonD family hydrolase